MHKLKSLILLVSATCLISSVYSASTRPTAAATTAKPQGFSSRSIEVMEGEEEFDTQAQTHLAYRQRQPVYDYSQSEEEPEEAPRQVYQTRNAPQKSNYYKAGNQVQATSEEQASEEAEEEEEPDRLSQLLLKSTFNCQSKNTGYYADESVSCEVFHYCQDNQRHSWICPEGFSFHQIHLICMPPSHDNICQQSSKFQFVNDYLYKPINLKEHQSKPNVTLRYSNRYFPENYYEQDEENDDEEPIQRSQPQRQPLQVGFRSQQAPKQQIIQQQQPIQETTYTPQAQPQVQYIQQTRQPVRHQPAPTQTPHQTQIYRRPIQTTTTIQPQVTQYRAPTAAPYVSPTPYRFYTASPQLSQQQAYRTPEEINISLQQRRPQFFVATSTPRYFEDEYLYERRK